MIHKEASLCQACTLKKLYLFNVRVNLQADISELVGKGRMTFSVEAKGEWSFHNSNVMHLSEKRLKLNVSAAEQFCINQGGHLASVGSQEEQEDLIKVANKRPVWLGGRRRADGAGWEWLDGRKWDFQNW